MIALTNDFSRQKNSKTNLTLFLSSIKTQTDTYVIDVDDCADCDCRESDVAHDRQGTSVIDH